MTNIDEKVFLQMLHNISFISDNMYLDSIYLRNALPIFDLKIKFHPKHRTYRQILLRIFWKYPNALLFLRKTQY